MTSATIADENRPPLFRRDHPMSSPPHGASEEDILVLGNSWSALASRAALELDNLLLGRDGKLVAIPWLATELASAVADQKGASDNQVRYNLVKVSVINRAFGVVGVVPRPTRVDEVVSQAVKLVESLKAVAKDPNGFREQKAEEVKRLRSFCLALARSTLASRNPRADRRRIGR
jgi:hypothetical protein